MKLILFDIDGTLIDSGGAGLRSMNAAFRELFSIESAFSEINLAGKTDLQIIKECLSFHGINNENGSVPMFLDAYLRHLRNNVDPRRGHVKKGIRNALQILTGREDHILALLTGNVEEGAYIKLGCYDLDGFFDTGAFGNEHEDRNRLLPIAVAKLREKGITPEYADCVVIGDTPRDVDCAKAWGARAIAVATGPYPAEALVAAGADEVFEDLSDTGRFLAAL